MSTGRESENENDATKEDWNEALLLFQRRVDDWRSRPILGQGLYARYQDARELLAIAERLLVVAREAGSQ